MNSLQAAQVTLLLETHEVSLRTLAEMVDQDPFTFYQGADLTGLNLDNQDLRGMNFAATDLRFTSLDNVAYDEGAFNGSYLEPSRRELQDNFHFYTADLLAHDNQEILIHCRFRRGSIGSAVTELMLNLSMFAKTAGISVNALRKARMGQVVAIETAQAIVRALMSLSPQTPPTPTSYIADYVLRQPLIEFLAGGINTPFKHISRLRYQELLSLRAEIKMLRRLMSTAHSVSEWRNTAESIEWTIRYYRERASEIDDAEARQARD